MEYAAASYVVAIPVVGGALGGAIKVLGGSEKALKAAKIVSKLTNLAGIGAMIAGPAIGACIDGKISASQIPGYIKQNNKLGLAFGALGLGALGYKGLKKANKLSDASQATKVANKVNEVSKTERKVADAGRTSGNKLELNLQFFASEGGNPSPNTLGKQGENFVSNELGLPHNTETISINGRDRIPDFIDLDQGIIAESKNVARQSYTRQLRDYVDKATEMGTKLELYVRQNTKLSKPLQKAIDEGLININKFPW